MTERDVTGPFTVRGKRLLSSERSGRSEPSGPPGLRTGRRGRTPACAPIPPTAAPRPFAPCGAPRRTPSASARSPPVRPSEPPFASARVMPPVDRLTGRFEGSCKAFAGACQPPPVRGVRRRGFPRRLRIRPEAPSRAFPDCSDCSNCSDLSAASPVAARIDVTRGNASGMSSS